MINKVNFTGRETLLGNVTKQTENVAKDYLCAGKVYSAEERLKANKKVLGTKHPFIAQDKPILKNEIIKPTVKEAKDVDVDFFAETTPYRFNVIG